MKKSIVLFTCEKYLPTLPRGFDATSQLIYNSADIAKVENCTTTFIQKATTMQLTRQFSEIKEGQFTKIFIQRKETEMFSQRDTEQIVYWEEKRSKSPYWYNINDPIILVDLSEIAARGIPETRQREFQLQIDVYQQRVPGKQENLLMGLSDALLRAIQQWLANRKVPLNSKCCVALHAVEPLTLPMIGCLAVLFHIPVFWFYPWSAQISKNMLAMMDGLSFNLLLAKLQKPKVGMKLVITIY